MTAFAYRLIMVAGFAVSALAERWGLALLCVALWIFSYLRTLRQVKGA